MKKREEKNTLLLLSLFFFLFILIFNRLWCPGYRNPRAKLTKPATSETPKPPHYLHDITSCNEKTSPQTNTHSTITLFPNLVFLRSMRSLFPTSYFSLRSLSKTKNRYIPSLYRDFKEAFAEVPFQKGPWGNPLVDGLGQRALRPAEKFVTIKLIGLLGNALFIKT